MGSRYLTSLDNDRDEPEDPTLTALKQRREGLMRQIAALEGLKKELARVERMIKAGEGE